MRVTLSLGRHKNKLVAACPSAALQASSGGRASFWPTTQVSKHLQQEARSCRQLLQGTAAAPCSSHLDKCTQAQRTAVAPHAARCSLRTWPMALWAWNGAAVPIVVAIRQPLLKCHPRHVSPPLRAPIYPTCADADRLSAAERCPSASGGWRVFSGNEIGALLAHWVWTNFRERHPEVSRHA